MRSRRGVSAVALLLLVLAQLGALSHAAAVRHVRCAIHGELVEAASIDAHRTDAVRLVGVHGGARDDAHCELAAALHHHTTAARANVTTSAIAHATPALPAHVTPVALATVHAYAPKTSPPARSIG